MTKDAHKAFAVIMAYTLVVSLAVGNIVTLYQEGKYGGVFGMVIGLIILMVVIAGVITDED